MANGGTGNANGAVNAADTLSTPRTVQVDLTSTEASTFDGSSNLVTGITGTLPVSNGGTGTTSLTTLRANMGIGYGTCSTSASTIAKTVDISDFTLVTGATVSVYFSLGSTSSSMTLNVNSTGAKTVYLNNSSIDGSVISAGDTVTFVYTGTYWFITSIANATNVSGGSDVGVGGIVMASYDLAASNNNYLSCNGSRILESDYPLLYNLLSSNADTWTSRTSGVSITLEGITYGNGMYVVVGASGKILTSTDGITWTSRTSGTSTYLYNITYANGMYVVVGNSGVILTSTNGITWTKRTSGVSTSLSDIIYGNGMYVIVGYSGVILTSTNGTTWTSRTSGVSTDLYSITYDNGMYVAVGWDGVILTSTDGITWTSRTSGVNTNLFSITYDNGMFVAVGWYGTILTSTDGITWTSRTSGITTALFSITYDNGMYIATGDSGVILTSTDGITWIERDSGVSTVLRGITYSNGMYVAVGNSGTIVTSGSDGSLPLTVDGQRTFIQAVG